MIAASLDQPVPEALVVSLHVIMLNILVDRVSEVLPAEEDHSIKTLGLDRSDKSLGVSVQIRTFGWEPHATDARRCLRLGKLLSGAAL